MSNINIPLDAHIAATVALQKAWINCNSAEDAALAAIAAAIEAWPDKRGMERWMVDGRSSIILPLEQTK
jgi:predicted RNA polymerase sigma factor